LRLTSFFAAAALLGIAACSSGTPEASASVAAAPAVHPESGLPVIPLTVTSKNGKHVFRVEVAATDAQQE